MKNDPSISETAFEESNWFSLIRVAVFLGVTFVGVAGLYGLLILLMPGVLSRYFDATFGVFAYCWVLGAALAFWGIVEGKTLVKMGFLPRRSEFLAGLAVGFCSILLLYGLGLVTGIIRLHGAEGGLFGVLGALVGAFGSAAAIVLLQEVLFRGYLLQTLMTDMPPWLAAVIASFLYAQILFVRPGRQDSLFPLIGFFLTGLGLAYAFLLTENLFLPIGLHGSWFFFLSFSDRLRLWDYPLPAWTGTGNPLCGWLGILMVLLIIGALRFVYGPIDWRSPRESI